MARWCVAAVAIVMFVVTAQRLLIIIGAVAAFRACKPTKEQTNVRALATFVGLLLLLSILAEIHVAT